MFEVEKEIRLLDLKIFRYLQSYIRNCFRYRKRKVGIPLLIIWGENQCNLRCKECYNRMPYIKQKHADINLLINSIMHLQKMALLDTVIISGGEPLLNKNLHKLLACLNSVMNIRKIYIVTNSTILPNEKFLHIMARTSKEIVVVMNEYQGVKNKIKEISKILETRNIHYVIKKENEIYWNGIGNDIIHPMHFETARMIYNDCKMRKTATLNENYITKCSRGASYGKGLKKFHMDSIRILKLKNNFLSRARLATCLDSNIHKGYCKYCFGLSDENPYLDTPGIQLK